MSRVRGPALRLGDDVNTDVIHPSRYYSLDDAKVRSGFLDAVSGRQRTGDDARAGSVVVAGRNFGCGSSRETGARVFKLKGVRVVLAESFARIFFRNLLNLGVAARVCIGLAERVAEDDWLEVDLTGDTVTLGSGEVLPLEPLDPYWREVLAAGGLEAHLGLDR